MVMREGMRCDSSAVDGSDAGPRPEIGTEMVARNRRILNQSVRQPPVSRCYAGFVTPSALLRAILVTLLALTPSALAQMPRIGKGLPEFTATRAAAKAAEDPSTSAQVLRARLRDVPQIAPPGSEPVLAIDLEIDPGWHIWVNQTQARALPGVQVFENAIFTSLAVEPSTTLRLSGVQWPEPHAARADVGDGPQDYAVYEGVGSIFVRLAMPSAAGEIAAELVLSVQACNERTCLAPDEVRLPIAIRVEPGAAIPAVPAGLDPARLVLEGGQATDTEPDQTVAFDFFGAGFRVDPRGFGLMAVLLVAFVGGGLLNFTPCVLPVIPLKIMALSAAAGDRARCLRLGAVMSAGVIFFWLLLGTMVGGLSGFTAANQLFQYPAFTIVLGVFIAVMALGMAGFFSVNLPQWVHGIQASHESAGGSFVMGIMTAVLSTPCTAPLMGAAAGWAATSGDLATVLTVFGAIGAGMAFPYVVLSAYPQMARSMPRSGPASDLVKQVMGLLLLAAAAFFVGAGVNGLLPQPSSLHWWVVGGIGAAAGVWMAWRTLGITRRLARRAVFAGLGVGIAAVSLGVCGTLALDHGPIAWTRYTPEALAQAKAEGQVLVLDFTAEWCLNCKALERVVLGRGDVAAAISQPGVAAIMVDITSRQSDGWSLLHTYGRATIPLLVVQKADGTVVLESDAYTPEQVLTAIGQATAR